VDTPADLALTPGPWRAVVSVGDRLLRQLDVDRRAADDVEDEGAPGRGRTATRATARQDPRAAGPAAPAARSRGAAGAGRGEGRRAPWRYAVLRRARPRAPAAACRCSVLNHTTIGASTNTDE
jgi:hypothetical protein